MGADLIGFFAKGPHRLDPSNRSQAIHEADCRLRWLRRARHLLDQLPPGSGENHREERAALVRLLADCPLFDVDREHPDAGARVDWQELRSAINDIVSALPNLDTADSQKVVDHFIASWPPRCRDAACVPDPDDPSKLLVFAGDRSWGDRPDGAGFRLLAQASVLGTGHALGVWIEQAFFTIRIRLLKEARHG